MSDLVISDPQAYNSLTSLIAHRLLEWKTGERQENSLEFARYLIGQIRADMAAPKPNDPVSNLEEKSYE